MLVKRTQVISSDNIDVVMHFYVYQNKFHMTRIKTKQLIVNSCWQTLHVILWYTWIQALSCMSLQYIICPCSPADHCRRWPWVITMETCSETLGFFHHIFISWSSQYCWIVFGVIWKNYYQFEHTFCMYHQNRTAVLYANLQWLLF